MKTKFMLFVAMILSTSTIIGMKEHYKMTIENQLNVGMFLNVPDPDTLTDDSPYQFVEGRKTKTFFLSQEEIVYQTIAIPGGWPSNKVLLPIEKKETHFIIKYHPESRQQLIIEDCSKKIISELSLLCKAQK